MGARVVAPALWASGRRRLQSMLITHGHPDHLGGAESVVEDFKPGWLWTGIPVAGHGGLLGLHAAARRAGTTTGVWLQGTETKLGPARIRVLHPEAPDWERAQVRNDDSVILEVAYRDVTVLMTGDVGAAAELAVLPRLRPSALRVLKVGHHGSRTSTTQELIEGWRPHVALISAGRGNAFGHPAPEVIERLVRAGVKVYRTDHDGQVTLETDGRRLAVRTFMGGPG